MARIGACAISGGRACRHRRRGGLRHMDRVGVQPHPRGQLPIRRGARKRQMGKASRGAPVHGRPRPVQQHHPHGALRHGDVPREALEEIRPQPQRARHRRLGLGQDARLHRAQHHADERQLLRDRPEGNHGRQPRVDAGAPRVRREGVRHHRLRPLHALQPLRLLQNRGRHPRVRRMLHRQHHGRQGACRRPVLGEGRAPALRRPHRLPRLPLPRGGPLFLRTGDAAVARQGEGERRGLHEPARPALRAGENGKEVRQLRGGACSLRLRRQSRIRRAGVRMDP